MENITVFFLSSIIIMTLVLPFSVKKVEEEIETFLLIMGIAAVSISDMWSKHLIIESIKEPLLIASAVFLMGVMLKVFREKIANFLQKIIEILDVRLVVFLFITIIGLISSIITAIIAALILSEFITLLKLPRKTEVKITVLGCFAIGFGAALTPVGEPLSTIVVSKLRGEPHNANFFFMLKKFWMWIIPFILISAFYASNKIKDTRVYKNTLKEDKTEDMKSISLRAVKVYIFVAALVLLGNGLKPFTDKYISSLRPEILYWLNSISAILDNATLAASEITPLLSERQITFLIMGLIISGGFLIPGNIPNIICASKLNIKSKEWAYFGLKYGIPTMIIYFFLLYFLA